MKAAQLNKSQYLQVRLDSKIKTQAESVLGEMGLSMTQAVRLFLRQVIMRKAIPFPVVIPKTKREFVSDEEEAMIEKSLKQISQGKRATLDMNDAKQVDKYFKV